MSADTAWMDGNRAHLLAALARVRRALEARAARHLGTPPPPDPGEALEAEAAPLAPEAALDVVTAAFGLSPFERDVLLLCAGVELDASWTALLARAAGLEGVALPTFGLALAALSDAHWSALTAGRPLRYWRLVELETPASVTAGALRIDEALLHFLVGVAAPDPRLQPYLEPLAAPDSLPASQARQVAEIIRLWQDGGASAAPVVELTGRGVPDLQAVAAAACAALGLRAFLLRGHDIPRAPHEREWLVRMWEREACLLRAALVVEPDEANAEATAGFLDRVAGFLVVAGSAGARRVARPCVRIEVDMPTPAEREAVWRSALGEDAAALDGHLRTVAAEFDLTPPEIAAAARHARAAAAPAGDPPPLRLWHAAQTVSRARLDTLAQRIAPRAGWGDLVLPRPQLEALRIIAAHVRHRERALGAWGFADKCARGLGTTAVFAGPSGTGKTLAAEVLARELSLDLYVTDVSQIVSRYLGDTEKNLKRVFDAAESGGAILLFDEADALFGRRTSDVRDSHDRYANFEVSYLLQRVEAFRGLAILTTNLKTLLDPAFLRRVRFVVEFPFPDAALRSEIWRRAVPDGVPTRGLDFAQLGRLSVAGGHIRNIAMTAAVISADRDEPLGMPHLLRAARLECAKLDRALSEAAVAGWH